MFRGIIIGIVIGYFFKPQIEVGAKKLIKIIKDNLKRGKKNYHTED